jgi:hypothetical protein
LIRSRKGLIFLRSSGGRGSFSQRSFTIGPVFKWTARGGIHIPSIKPLGTPVHNRVNKAILEELFLLILAKLDTTTTQARSTVTRGCGFKRKK